MSQLALTRLLQLASPALPVGAYSYSQGLEWAIEAGWIKDETSAGQWINDVLQYSLLSLELPLLGQLMAAWSQADHAQIVQLNEQFFASRESRELYEETRQMGYSLLRLINDLPLGDEAGRALLLGLEEVSFPTAWAFAATSFQVEPRAALTAYAFSWLENQVMAALKAVPLGQLSGQRLLMALSETLAPAIETALQQTPEHWNNLTPGLALASCQHETQYSRLFRS